MDLCQKNETDIENNENKRIEGIEETELTLTCPDQRSERNHVCCLLRISDLTLEEDKRVNEFAVGTGWEEAVHGWGRTSSTACIWSRKKVKRRRSGEGACSSSSCLFCLSLSQGGVEARLPSGGVNPEERAVAEVDPSTASREPHKLCFPTSAHGQKKSLQIKEFIWGMENWAIPETVSAKAPRNPNRGMDRGLPTSDSLTSKALVVLPPLKNSPRHNLEALSKKSRNVLWHSEEKVPRAEQEECVVCTAGSKRVGTIDGKGKKRPSELASHLKVTDMLSLRSHATRTPVLAQSQRCCLRWSLLPERSSVCPPNPVNIHYLATLELLQKQGIQSCRAKFKAKEPKPPRSTHKHILTEPKQRNRPQTVENKMFPKPFLPSLTVSRVVIPVSTQRVL